MEHYVRFETNGFASPVGLDLGQLQDLGYVQPLG